MIIVLVDVGPPSLLHRPGWKESKNGNGYYGTCGCRAAYKGPLRSSIDHAEDDVQNHVRLSDQDLQGLPPVWSMRVERARGFGNGFWKQNEVEVEKQWGWIRDVPCTTDVCSLAYKHAGECNDDKMIKIRFGDGDIMRALAVDITRKLDDDDASLFTPDDLIGMKIKLLNLERSTISFKGISGS